MIVGYITTLQLGEIERTGRAEITQDPAGEGVVSFALVYPLPVPDFGRMRFDREIEAMCLPMLTDEQAEQSWDRWRTRRGGE